MVVAAALVAAVAVVVAGVVVALAVVPTGGAGRSTAGSPTAGSPTAGSPTAATPAVRTPTAGTPSAPTRPITLPPTPARFDYQLGGPYTPAPGTGIVDRDRTERPVPGVYSICYVNAFQTQPGDARWAGRDRDLVLRDASGAPVRDPDWDEDLLDTSTAAKRERIAAIVGGWIDECARKGFQAVEPDNLDSWTRSGAGGHRLLTEQDNLRLAALLARRAHDRGLAIAQKNAAELGARGRDTAGFDFAIAEECQPYGECGAYTRVYGDRVIEIEYTDGPRSAFTAACAARGSRVSVLLRDRDVVPKGAAGYHSEHC